MTGPAEGETQPATGSGGRTCYCAQHHEEMPGLPLVRKPWVTKHGSGSYSFTDAPGPQPGGWMRGRVFDADSLPGAAYEDPQIIWDPVDYVD